MSDEWPLVGRTGTLREIAATAASGRRAGVVLVGPPGVGRTRLARAALAAVCGTGPDWTPFWVMASRSTTGIPLGAMGHLFGDLETTDDGPAAGGPGTARLLRAARERLRELTGGYRAVLAVDDAHVLDETSAILLQQLAISGDAFLLVTAPSGVVVPSPVFALWKEGLADRVDIDELDRRQADQLVVNALCGDEPGTVVDDGALAKLWRLSGGNPLLLRELVDGGLDARTLHRVGAVWRWEGPFPRTARLTELVDAQMGDLPSAERDLMRLLAFGQPLDSEIASTLVNDETLGSAERRGLLTSTRNGSRVDLHVSRPLHAEVLRGRATPLQEREIYRRLSEAAESVASVGDGMHRAEDRWRMVSWRVARGLSADPEELLDAVVDVGSDDPELAERLLTAAAEQDDARPAVRLRLAGTMIRYGQLDRAESVLAPLDAGPDRVGADGRIWPQRADVALMRVHNLYWGLRAFDRLPRVLSDGLGDAPDPATAGTEYPARTALRAFRSLVEGRATEAVKILAPATADQGAGLPVLAVAALAAAKAGRYGTVGELAVRGDVLRLDREFDDGAGGWLRFETLAAWWYARLQSGDLDGADRIAEPCLRSARERGLDRYAALFTTWIGITQSRRGRPEAAAGWLLQAASAVPADRFSFTMPLVSELAMALAATGRTNRAAAVLAEGERVPGDLLLAGWAYAARVMIAGVEGRTSQAATIALEAADAADTHGHRMQALHTAVRMGLTGAVSEQLVALAADAEGPLEQAYGEHATALAEHDAAGLDRVATRFAGMGLDLLAAEAAAQAAHAYRAAGQIGSAAAVTSRARAWAQECQGARTPALELLEGSADLTPREHEIAALAATGMTSKAIAGELVVSVRTVDNVLRSVYAKLGVSGRGDLVQVAGIRRG
ncbi:helix-turn-helix transcriptional regulator [Pseudonocardia endophytica]|uniref:AAA ATPase-like protein n=1 Tax=Pseudonocardia endophytica TaxID=401976 RepID=A0A4R1I107_PSEEN|nr:LuxR C-terminal-related transcriptional regulator [Pseudonocardia endophytica]TCK26109.1 AAA ATPase-like protein [Pseudonocardia endophytica]